MPTTRAKSVRRAATKRTILSALDENNPSNDHLISSTTGDKVPCPSNSHHNSNGYGSNPAMENAASTPPQRPFRIPKDLDCANSDSINILIKDIEREVKSRQENVAIMCCEALKRQHEALFLKGMKLEKSVKKMKIKDFNAKFMQKNSTINNNGYHRNSNDDKCSTDIIAMLKSLMNDSPRNGSSMSNLSKKRFRDDLPDLSKMDLETPIRPLRTAGNFRTPATVLRTAKRGEVLMSANGSPIEQCEEGALVATVSKKRRANGIPGEAMFDINFGGKVISLSDPNSVSNLDNQMKNTVTAQLNLLQDQISKLMTQIDS